MGGTWLFITVVLLLLAIVLRQVPLLLVAMLFFLASSMARLWARYALERVEYSRRLSATRAFFGETITLEIRIANHKILPLPWVNIQDEVPEEVTFLKGNASAPHAPMRVLLSNLVSLGWYRRLTRRFPVQCLHRGYFEFGPTTIRTGDLFGFFHNETVFEERNCLLVYPRIVPLERLGIPSRDPFGDLRVRQHLFEDPVRVVGIRDYVHGDPLKRIHWKAVARLQRLQTKVFEPTTTVDMALFLDVRTTQPPTWGLLEQLLETAVIAAASIANHAVDNGYRVGLYVNEPYKRTPQTIKLTPSDHPQQLQRVLEALAQVQGIPFITMEQMLNSEARGLPWGATLVVITAVPTDPLLASLKRFRRAGRRVALVQVGGQESGISSNGIPAYHVSDRVYWREIESMAIAGEAHGRQRGGHGRAR